MEQGKLRMAVIGCGRVAVSHLQACQSVPQVELVAVVDINPEVAASVADMFRCPTYYTSHADLLRQKTLDAAIVCTPPASHAPIVLDLMAQGVNVLCEKPFTTTLRDAERMAEAADSNGVLLMMASKFRFVEDVIKARDIIASGILGDIVLYENVFCSRVNMRGRWNSVREIAGGGVLIDNGSHAVDVARYLIGPIVAVQAQHGKQVQPIEVEDTSSFYFRTSSGVLGVVDLSWSIHKETDVYIAIYGTEGTLTVGWKESRYRQSEKLDWVRFGKGYDKQEAFTRQLQHFVNCLLGKEKPLMTTRDAVESVRVIEAAYRSAELNKWLSVDAAQGVE